MEEDYEPFGPEWEKQLMKYPKAFLIDLYRRQCLRSQKQSEIIKPLIVVAQGFEMCFPQRSSKQKKRVQRVIDDAQRLVNTLP